MLCDDHDCKSYQDNGRAIMKGSVQFVCVVYIEVLWPSQPIGSCRARSVYLTTRLLGRLSPLSG